MNSFKVIPRTNSMTIYKILKGNSDFSSYDYSSEESSKGILALGLTETDLLLYSN